MYYELIHNQLDLKLVLPYEDWLRLQDSRYYRFDRRIFVKLDPSQLVAKTELLVDFTSSRTQFGDGRFVAAAWFADLIKLTQHYPIAYRQLQFALSDGTSVDAFASSLAKVFCLVWQRIRDIQQRFTDT